jgi:CheY-like chemotaxis protein
MVHTACLIDDDTIYLFIMRRLLTQLGLCAHIIEFNDPQEAIAYFKNGPEEMPTIIMVDLNMPLMDGWEFLEAYGELEKTWVNRPTVYMVSSSIDSADIARAKLVPQLKGYLTKPLSEETLRRLFDPQ